MKKYRLTENKNKLISIMMTSNNIVLIIIMDDFDVVLIVELHSTTVELHSTTIIVIIISCVIYIRLIIFNNIQLLNMRAKSIIVNVEYWTLDAKITRSLYTCRLV